MKPFKITFPDRYVGKIHFIIGLAILCYLVAGYFQALALSSSGFPNSFSWTDLLINYQAGFVKRGLLGEIAYQLDDWIPAANFILLVLGASYLFCMAVLIAIWKLHTRWTGLFFILSPAGLLFPIYDPNVAVRKDIVIITVLILSLLLIRNLKTNKALLPVLILLYGVGTLVVEITLLYFPIVYCVYLHHQSTAPITRRLLLSVLAAGFMAALLGFTLWSTDVSRQMIEAIAASWNAKYPNAFPNGPAGQLGHLGDGVQKAMKFSASVAADPSMRNGYLLAAALALVPVMILALSSRLSHIKPLTALAFAAGIACSVAPLFLSSDWGRYIYILAVHVFLGLWCIVLPRPISLVPAHVLIVLLLIFSTSWNVVHWAPPGSGQNPITITVMGLKLTR